VNGKVEMGDWTQAVVDVEVDEAEAAELADRVIAHLVDRGIVVAELSDSGLGSDGHRPGPRCSEAIAEPEHSQAESFRSLRTNGVCAEVGRAIHATPDEPDEPEVVCPACSQRIAPEIWFDAAEEWCNDAGPALVACPGCRVVTPVRSVPAGEEMILGSLALVFWNWPPLSDDFLDELRTILSPRSVVQTAKW
jgi:hypothetical protein